MQNRIVGEVNCERAAIDRAEGVLVIELIECADSCADRIAAALKMINRIAICRDLLFKHAITVVDIQIHTQRKVVIEPVGDRWCDVVNREAAFRNEILEVSIRSQVRLTTKRNVKA